MNCTIAGCARRRQGGQFVCVYHAALGPDPETTLAERAQRAQRAPRGSIDSASTLPLRMPAELRHRLDTAARQEGLSVAEWIRRAVEAVL